MEADCTLTAMPNNVWRIRHSSSALGEVEIRGSSREEALSKMRKELQYRMELCPCTGESVGAVELKVREEAPPKQ
jgi:hypothetical protein